MRLRTLITTLGLIIIVLFTLLSLVNSLLLVSFKSQTSNDAYHLTNGLIVTPTQTTLVEFQTLIGILQTALFLALLSF